MNLNIHRLDYKIQQRPDTIIFSPSQIRVEGSVGHFLFSLTCHAMEDQEKARAVCRRLFNIWDYMIIPTSSFIVACEDYSSKDMYWLGSAMLIPQSQSCMVGLTVLYKILFHFAISEGLLFIPLLQSADKWFSGVDVQSEPVYKMLIQVLQLLQ